MDCKAEWYLEKREQWLDVLWGALWFSEIVSVGGGVLSALGRSLLDSLHEPREHWSLPCH